MAYPENLSMELLAPFYERFYLFRRTIIVSPITLNPCPNPAFSCFCLGENLWFPEKLLTDILLTSRDFRKAVYKPLVFLQEFVCRVKFCIFIYPHEGIYICVIVLFHTLDSIRVLPRYQTQGFLPHYHIHHILFRMFHPLRNFIPAPVTFHTIYRVFGDTFLKEVIVGCAVQYPVQPR